MAAYKMVSPPLSSPVASAAANDKTEILTAFDGPGRQFEYVRTCFKQWKAASAIEVTGDNGKLENELVTVLREALGTQKAKKLDDDVKIDREGIKAAAILMMASGVQDLSTMEDEDLEAVRILLLMSRADRKLVSCYESCIRHLHAIHVSHKQ